MTNIRATVIGPGGTPVTGVTLRATIAGSTSTYRDPWPATFPAPESGVLTLETTGGGFNNDSVDILLNQGAPAAWTNPNVAVDRRGSDIAIDFCVFSIREVPLKVISPNDVVAEDYPVPYSPDLAAGQTSKVDADNDRLARELGTRYAGRAIVFDVGGGRPQYRGFDDFPKPHCLCMDPDPSTGKVLLTASTSGWDRVRHAAKSDLDPTLGGITYVLTWGEGSNALLVGVFVPKAKSMIARTRVSCVFYTSNTAKPEFQTDYPFGWRWFPVRGSPKVTLVQPFFDLIGRYLFQGHFLALQTLLGSTADPPPVMIVPVWPKSDASPTRLLGIKGLVELVREVGCFVHRCGLDNPVTAPERDERSTFARSPKTDVARIHSKLPESSIAVACHSAAIDNALTLAQTSPGTMDVGEHRSGFR